MHRRLITVAALVAVIVFPVIGSAAAPKSVAEKGWSFSVDDGVTFSTDAPTIPGGQKATILAKCVFNLAAHEHHYERSDLPGGLYQIIAAGAGAPRSGRGDDAKRQNPYAKVFAASLNFCVIDADDESCTLKALSPTGKVLDTLTWKPRKVD